MLHTHGQLDPGLPAFGWSAVWTQWSANPLLLAGTLAVIGAYGVGVVALRRRGDAWSWWRVLAFATAIAAWLIATSSGLATYDRIVIRAHMIQHMVLSMAVPLFLALSAPLTLALRVLPVGGRRRLMRVLHSKFARVLTFLPLTLALYVSGPWLLYFTGWYAASLRSLFVHEMMHVHLVTVGALFFWPLVGIDPVPGRVSYPLRLLAMILTLPFHAFLGVTLMAQKRVIGDGWYEGLVASGQYPWLTDPWEDQHRAGGLLWLLGDVMGVVFGLVLFVQWVRQSQREAERLDRQLDREEARAADVG